MKFEQFLNIKEEFASFAKKDMTFPDADYSFLEQEAFFEDEELDEASTSKGTLRTSSNPLAKLFRWGNTHSAKGIIDKVYKKHLSAMSGLIANDVKIELKKDEIGKISGPEAKAKMKELNALDDRNKLKKEKLAEEKKQAIDKLRNPDWFFAKGSVFGFNDDVLDKYIALKNADENLAMNELKLKAAKNVLTDKEMEKLKTQVKQLKAREIKYSEELKSVEQAVKNSIEKDDYTGGDAEIKAEKERLDRKIEEVDKDIEDYRDKMSSETDNDKKEDYAKNLAALEKNKKSYQRDMDVLIKKAKKAVLGSTTKEEDA